MDHLRNVAPETVPGIAPAAGLGETFSHFRLNGELGRGYSSVVYQATDLARRRGVALKVLTLTHALDGQRRQDLAERFRREAQAVSALSHPNIIAIYEAGEDGDGRQFIAMEHLRGETLRERLRRAGPMPVPEAVAVAVQVADALHYAHGRGVIHRDVKPDNIFLAGAGDAEATPKLMDFGIAHVLHEQGLTQDGLIVGSPAYMSPEQVNGGPLDARTDVFSLAVTLVEMMTGGKPFEAETVPGVMQKILHHPPSLGGVADRGLRRVLSRALARNPAGRYPDALLFAQALRQAAPAGVPILTTATQVVSDDARRASRPSRGAFPTAAALMGALALGTLAALPLLTTPPSPAVRAQAAAPAVAVASVPSAPASAFSRGERRHEIWAAWHPGPPRKPSRPVLRAGVPALARIAETPRPVRLASRQLGSQEVTASPPPLAPALPARQNLLSRQNPTVRPNPPALPVAPRRPLLAAVPRLRSARPHLPPAAFAAASVPIIRIAESRQEMTHTARIPPAAVSTNADAPQAPPQARDIPPPPPPRARGLADSPPRLLHRALAPLPPDTDGQWRDAWVRLRLWVDEDGQVTDAEVIRSSGNLDLNSAALDAVGQWEYDPAIRNGQSVAGTVVEDVHFASR